jgi:glycosyltransferase involved in cell wall biosynthesis
MGVDILGKETLQKIDDIKEADILFGIPSYNNASTIGHVVQSVQVGLAKYFPDKKSVIINSDGGSTDGTMDIVKNTAIDESQSILLSRREEPIVKIITPYHGIPGKGSAFRTIFEIANALKVKACAVIDSDLRSITPEWIELLIKPLLDDNYQYVTPLYYRHKYDGTITNNIIYPLTRALYGKRVRQPIGGEFGFSGELADFFLTKDIWETNVARYGIDIWMTTTAIANNFRICQSFLGAKIYDPKDPGADLSSMLYQVVGSTFDLMETYSPVWSMISGSELLPISGSPHAVRLEPVFINLDRMIEKFRLGVTELMDIWKRFFPEEIVYSLQKTKHFQRKEFYIPDDLWAKIIYSFAIAAHRKLLSIEHLLKSLTPLYLGKVASFVIETWESSSSEVEEKIERLCISFENEKEYLIKNWD